MKSTLVLLLVLGLCLSAEGAARAQSVDSRRVAAAQTLYDQAVADMAASRYAAACPKLEEVTRLVPEGLGAKLTLAECYEAGGKKASAWAQYAAVESLATKANQPERAARASEKAAALRPKLATITLDVPPAVREIEGIAILRDGVPVGPVQWGVPVPADKGSHDIVITAPGRKPVTLSIDVPADGAKLTATATAPEIVVKAAPPPPVRPWQRPAAIGAVSLGGAGLVAGAVLGGLAISTNGGVADHCNEKGFCDRTGTDLRNQARLFGDGATAAFAVGGAILAGGAVLFATAPPAPKSDETSLRVVVSPALLRVEGRF